MNFVNGGRSTHLSQALAHLLVGIPVLCLILEEHWLVQNCLKYHSEVELMPLKHNFI